MSRRARLPTLCLPRSICLLSLSLLALIAQTCTHTELWCSSVGAPTRTLTRAFFGVAWHLASWNGICKIGDMCVDHMTIEILCADLCDIWAKFVGVTERNVFCKNRPHGGAIPGLSRKCGSEVHCWHPRSVCAQFHSNRTSGPGDYAVTDGHTHTRTRCKT